MSSTRLRTAGLLLLCAGGIYASYLTQGIVQETLATKRFGPDARCGGTAACMLACGPSPPAITVSPASHSLTQ